MRTIQEIPAAEPTYEEAENAYCLLGFNSGLSEEQVTAVVEGSEPERIVRALLDLIETAYDNEPAAATAKLFNEIQMRTELIQTTLAADRPGAVRDVVTGDFLRNLERAQAHVSRELDRSLRRFNEMKASRQTRPVEEADSSSD